MRKELLILPPWSWAILFNLQYKHLHCEISFIIIIKKNFGVKQRDCLAILFQSNDFVDITINNDLLIVDASIRIHHYDTNRRIDMLHHRMYRQSNYYNQFHVYVWYKRQKEKIKNFLGLRSTSSTYRTIEANCSLQLGAASSTTSSSNKLGALWIFATQRHNKSRTAAAR